MGSTISRFPGGAAQVLEYLSRYTHRTAISNERIHAINDQEVVFLVRANDKGGKRLERLPGQEMDVGLCPCCKVGRLQVTAVLQGQARLPAPAGVVAQQRRGAGVRCGRVHMLGISAQEAGGGAARLVEPVLQMQQDTSA